MHIFIPLLVFSLIPSLSILSFINLFVRPSIRSFIYSSIYSFIYLVLLYTYISLYISFPYISLTCLFTQIILLFASFLVELAREWRSVPRVSSHRQLLIMVRNVVLSRMLFVLCQKSRRFGPRCFSSYC